MMCGHRCAAHELAVGINECNQGCGHVCPGIPTAPDEACQAAVRTETPARSPLLREKGGRSCVPSLGPGSPRPSHVIADADQRDSSGSGVLLGATTSPVITAWRTSSSFFLCVVGLVCFVVTSRSRMCAHHDPARLDISSAQ